jgi:hypothetical protein
MDTSKLAPDTLRVWEFLAAQPALGGFILIGGTALTMRIGHRVSEDLDLVTVADRLPRAALNGLVMILERNGFTVSRDDDPTAYEEFLIAGDSLHDHQQNFLFDGVKVNIFTPNSDLEAMVEASDETLVRIASLPELFRTKALASANRCLSRDWIDLFVLFNQHGFTLSDFSDAFHRPGVHHAETRISRAFANLCRGSASASDPGYEVLMEKEPTLAELAAFFSTIRDTYQTELARKAFKGQK